MPRPLHALQPAPFPSPLLPIRVGACAALPGPPSPHQAKKSINVPTARVQIPNVVAAAASILVTMEEGVSAYEKEFRVTYGNTPDTSKALRL